MNNYVTGAAVKALREKRGYTQKQLAERLSVSDKAVSKWETGRGLPDITLIEPLARALGVSLTELLSGDCMENRNRAGNLVRGKFYVCPVCGNVIFASGEGSFSCCGVALPPLDAEEPDKAHAFTVESVEDEWYVTVAHPMSKAHHLSFLAIVSGNRLEQLKLYPEQSAAGRFKPVPGGVLYAFCNRHGLFAQKL